MTYIAFLFWVGRWDLMFVPGMGVADCIMVGREGCGYGCDGGNGRAG
jgi:hypothetical protein